MLIAQNLKTIRFILSTQQRQMLHLGKPLRTRHWLLNTLLYVSAQRARSSLLQNIEETLSNPHFLLPTPLRVTLASSRFAALTTQSKGTPLDGFPGLKELPSKTASGLTYSRLPNATCSTWGDPKTAVAPPCVS